MRIAITGSTGLIGSALGRSLRSDGHEVVRLVRREPVARDEVRWAPERRYVDAQGLSGCDAVVHLAGAGVGDHRWTAAYKQELVDSRVLGTAAIAEAVASLDTPPQVLVCGTAIGIYGDTGDRPVDETAPPGEDFLASLCRRWEGAAAPARDSGIRTAFARTGLVVARRGGAWGQLFPIYRAGLGGRLGDGRQFWSFISLHDEIAAIRHIIDTPALSGPVNLTGPEPLTNRDINRAMGRVLHRPAVFAVPAPVLRLVLGEFADDVLASQRVIPRKLMDSGFAFAFPGIEASIRAALT
jgi:uncharacterized protein (TIGR01777 family)